MSAAFNRGCKPTLTADAEALTRTPRVPPWLSDYGKAEWQRVAPLLVSRRILTAADLGALEAYCAAAGSARQIAAQLAATGTLPDPKLAGVQIRFATLARQLGAELGLSPVSRARLGAVAPAGDDDDDPLAV